MLPRGPIDVRFEDVSFAYPGGPLVLHDVDLDIDAGRRVAVVGETGSGKSTVAKLLTRLMDPVAGAVLLDGVDVRQIAAGVAAPQRRAGAAGGLPLRRHHHRQRPLRQARRDRGRDPRQRRRARPRRLAGRPAARPRHPGRPARRVALGGGAAAGRAAPRPPRRPRPARPRRGDQRGRPRARDADRPGPRAPDERPHVGHDRAPDVHRRVRRRGRRRRPRPDRAARPARRARRPGRLGLRRACTPRGWPSRAPDARRRRARRPRPRTRGLRAAVGRGAAAGTVQCRRADHGRSDADGLSDSDSDTGHRHRSRPRRRHPTGPTGTCRRTSSWPTRPATSRSTRTGTGPDERGRGGPLDVLSASAARVGDDLVLTMEVDDLQRRHLRAGHRRERSSGTLPSGCRSADGDRGGALAQTVRRRSAGPDVGAARPGDARTWTARGAARGSAQDGPPDARIIVLSALRAVCLP